MLPIFILCSIFTGLSAENYVRLDYEGNVNQYYDYTQDLGCSKKGCEGDVATKSHPRVCNIVDVQSDKALIIAVPPYPIEPLPWGNSLPESYDKIIMIEIFYEILVTGLEKAGLVEEVVEEEVVEEEKGEDCYDPPETSPDSNSVQASMQDSSDTNDSMQNDQKSGDGSADQETTLKPNNGARRRLLEEWNPELLYDPNLVMNLEEYLVAVYECLSTMLDILYPRPSVCNQTSVENQSCCRCFCACRTQKCLRCPLYCCRDKKMKLKKYQYINMCRDWISG